MLGSLDGCESSVAGCHDAGNRVHINLFSDVPRLDDLLLAGYSDQVVRANLGETMKPSSRARSIEQTFHPYISIQVPTAFS